MTEKLNLLKYHFTKHSHTDHILSAFTVTLNTLLCSVLIYNGYTIALYTTRGHCCIRKVAVKGRNTLAQPLDVSRTLSEPTEHVKSEEVGCRTSEPLDTLIGGVLANQRGLWEGQNTVCTLFFSVLRHLLFSCFGVLA